jgi:transposase
MSEQQRRKYDPEFKRNAVLLTEEVGRTVGEVADRLGISVDLLYQWRKRYRQQGNIAFPGNGNSASLLNKSVFESLRKG